MDESDADLLAATARGDAEAFGRLYRRHEHRVLSYAITRCTNAADVADVVGETFLAALGAAARFRDDGGDAIPWLFGIARRVLAHQRRSFARRQRLVHRLGQLPSLNPDEAEAVEAAIDASRLARRLAAAMATLRQKDRELLRLVSGDGLSPAQAGAVLGMNANTARIVFPAPAHVCRACLPAPNSRPARTRRCPMLSFGERPALPAIPRFSQEMERALVAAARTGSPRRAAAATWLRSRAAAGIAVAAVAVAIGAGIGYAVTSSHPGGHAATGPTVHIHATAFSVDSSGTGTVTVTIMRNHVRIDPAALRHALAEAGVPALVTAGHVCSVPGPSAALGQVLGAPQHRPGGATVLNIVPAAIPRGQELSIGFFQVPGGGGIHVSLVPVKGPLTCASLPPAPPHR